ncbi:energy transducer TonB [Parerythrobacter aurantius]|uniref:energy transducer TonB n=1 Tax=Parerythrobacter aurantius TaxID=3127706 RepID=UPI00324A5A05
MTIPLPPQPPRFSSVPKPRNNPGSWVVSDDYPKISMLLDEAGRSQFRATVDVSGEVSGCSILDSSGFKRLDELTCRLVTQRARFDPALDYQGKPIVSQYTQAVVWRISEPLQASDFGWKRPTEAKKLKQRGTVGFEVEISSDGTITSCRITRSSGSALLDAETCKRLEALKSPSIALDEAGQPVARTVRSRISW